MEYLYGKRIKASLRTFIKNYESDQSAMIKKNRKKSDSYYWEAKKLSTKADKEIEIEFKGNEDNRLILETIRLINTFHRIQPKRLNIEI